MCIRCLYKLFGLNGTQAGSDDGLMLQGSGVMKRSSLSRNELSHVVNGAGTGPIPSNKYGILSGSRHSNMQLSDRTRQLQKQSKEKEFAMAQNELVSATL
ncbi:hypothetical protein ElyMa_005274100 [Elysia marginata]|uniref:Uncharacterized protein n=1 Tax=Elysia marginata TaxID=1093978 RepID=A0AAV4K3Q8_9GAST|nr:hypothetical protein ElyMa_005274100 [Elysia marginata]